MDDIGDSVSAKSSKPADLIGAAGDATDFIAEAISKLKYMVTEMSASI